MSDTFSKPLAIWQVTPCPSWCGGHHRDGDDLEDRFCHSKYQMVARSLVNAVEVSYPTRIELDELRVGLAAEYRDLLPYVVVAYGSGLTTDDTSDDYRLALEEASALAEVIFALVAEARSGKVVEDRPWVAWQRTPCPAWCTGGHHTIDGPDARVHSSEERRVALSMEPTLQAGREIEDWFLDRVAVGMECGVREYEPRLSFYREAGGFELTLAEAEQFAATLVELVFEGRPAALDISELTTLPVLYVEPKAR